MEYPRKKTKSTLKNRKIKVISTKRGKGRKNKNKFNHKKTKFSIVGCNANGIKAKLTSLKNTLRFYNNPSVVTIQETKIRGKGSIKIPGYKIFTKN